MDVCDGSMEREWSGRHSNLGLYSPLLKTFLTLISVIACENPTITDVPKTLLLRGLSDLVCEGYQ